MLHADYMPLGAITTQQAALTSLRLKTVLETLDPSAYCLIKTDDFNGGGFEVREISDGSENDSNVMNMYGCRGVNDDLSLIATITGAQGTQVYKGKTDEFYADTMAVSEVDEGFRVTEFSTAANNIATNRFVSLGFSRFLFIATTLATTTLKLQAAPMDLRFLDGT